MALWEALMTENRALYFENKYKLFIRVWQSSDSINEVQTRLHDIHGWYESMEDGYARHSRGLPLRNVRSYAYRLRKKGVELKQLHTLFVPPDIGNVDYKMLNEYAQKAKSIG